MNVPSVSFSANVTTLGYGDCMRFGKLLLDRCGLLFPESRYTELELAVRHAFGISTCADLDEYYRLLRDPENGSVEMDRLINTATVGETHFFRDQAQFDALYNHVLPQIIERRRSVRALRIWSAGCASGEEPYSIAILLRELLPDVDKWAITILGTDINTESLDRARRAIYSSWAFREERAKQWQSRYFRPCASRFKLVPEVQRMVTFARLNLVEPSYPSVETNTILMDLILCRNVTIYFSEKVTLEIAEQLHKALVDGGWLVVGHTEPSLTVYRCFQARNYPATVLYQRIDHPATQLSKWNWGEGSPNGHITPRITFPPHAPVLVPSILHVTPPQDTPLSSNGDLLDRARELLEYGHSEEAHDMLVDLVGVKPHSASACALLGQACANLGHLQDAEEWCRRAVSLDKLILEAYYILALVLQHQGKLDQAIDVMKKVVYIDHNHVLGHFGLANLYRDSGQLDQVHKSLNNAYRLLKTRPAEETIPGSGGITAGRLREAIARQQWVQGVQRKAQDGVDLT